ncbi:disease resistance protein L6-like [Syzygium oleosum]|uniref:disease resistance protein L6-like n=1 Tax=Syzygium oleosum TaxID=219896 RepID=UPI0024BAA423|nr:disease resistance protein L6-like [Syzygium oleosum]
MGFLVMANLEPGTISDAPPELGGEYQVFLSFRGPDTRHGFTDFLYHGLHDAGVRVFRDDEELRVGEVIGKNLLSAIDNSTLFIPIFSPTYASSKWCLRELAHIIFTVSKSEVHKSILPIFFHVKAEDVKLKTPLYSHALEKHKEEFPDEVEAWRAALVEVGKIKGWNVKKDQGQAMTVKTVVKEVLQKQEIKQKSVTEHLVGVDDRINNLIESLNVNHPDVQFIGIYGMGGIGKTTVAKVIFNQLSSHFGKCCSFLEDVRESSSTKEGIVQLQKKLLCDIVGSGSAEKVINSDHGMRMIGKILRTKKVLVVLDDVDNKELIRKLLGNDILHSGSRIIITTRITTVLEVKGFEVKRYEMQKMDDDSAHQLFCRHSFGRDSPSNNYHGLSKEIVSSMGGLPLAIEVVGSLLYHKEKAFWEETLLKLRRVHEKEILKKLRISYDDLSKDQQEIFLDIACFFVNEKKTDAIYVWTHPESYPVTGIDMLTNRCLIKILDNGKFWMHDQLIKLGRQIVCEESPNDLGKQSRLWIAKEALEIIRTKERKDKVRALEIDGLGDSITITKKEFERLHNLRFLKLGNGTFAGDLAKCRSKLRWISLHSPHKNFRADNMSLDHLLVFKLESNGFTDDAKAWELIKSARNLKVLSLTRCNGITTIPDISKCLGLERLTLAFCKKLRRIENFIGELNLLIELEIKSCIHLIDLPKEVEALVKLERFSLLGCSELKKLPVSLGSLTSLIELDLSDTRIRELPNSIGKLESLRVLRLPKSSPENHVWQLPNSISMLKNLVELDLSGRDQMKGEIPAGIGELSYLRTLNLKGTLICGIPGTVNKLQHLQTLNLRDCHKVQELPELPTSLTCLLFQSESLLSVPNLSNLTNLVELLLGDGSRNTSKSNLSKGSGDGSRNLRWIGRLSRLKKLELNLLDVPAPPELADVSHLEELILSRLDLGKLQLPSSLRRLKLLFFRIRWAEELPSYLRLRNLSTLQLSNGEVEDIPLGGLPQLENLIVNHCKLLKRLSFPSGLDKLRQARVSHCRGLVEIQVLELSKSLESFTVFMCKSLTKIDGLSNLKNLEKLQIERCGALTNVEGLDKLESLKFLQVINCPSLKKLIDASGMNMPDDCLVQIQRCGDFIKDSRPSYGYQSGISLKCYRKDSHEPPSKLRTRKNRTRSASKSRKVRHLHQL